MSELLNSLESLISKMGGLIEIQRKSKSFSDDVMLTTFYKSSEDGILDHIHKANPHQIKVMLGSYKWRFYTQYNDSETLALEIQRRIRDKKLEKLC
jgi:hypothetical protein